jgi:hypothetical protein
MSALLTLGELIAPLPLLAAGDDGAGWLLIAGPLAAAATYGALFSYYRNTGKSHEFERTTRIDAQPVVANDSKINEVRRTKRTRIKGDNRNDHRERVQRLP